jgi:hypothetical protein
MLALCLLLNANAAAASELYPVDVQELADGGARKIVRVYELAPEDDPDAIPRDAFERGGYCYELTDIVRQETALEDKAEHTETVTLTTESRDLAAILPLLATTMEYVGEDGYAGVLILDTTTVVTVEGNKTKQAYTMTTTREYPHLSSNDTSLLPKTVTERGLTYTLESVDWRGNNETVDYGEFPEYYTAIATYKTSGASTKVTDYITTAEYRGEIIRTSPGKTRYTAYFAGTPLSTPTPKPTAAGETVVPKTAFNPAPILIAAGAVALLGCGGYLAYRKLKIKKF